MPKKQSKSPTKKELETKIQKLENDYLDLANAFIGLEEDFQLLKKMMQQGYDPYNNNSLLRNHLRSKQLPIPTTIDNSITVNVKR